MKKELLIGTIVGLLLGALQTLIAYSKVQDRMAVLTLYIIIYGIFGLIIGSYVGLIKKRKKLVFKSWVFWIITIYLLTGFYIHFTSSIARYQANESQYDLFVKCINNETMNEDETYTCNSFKEWGVDMEDKVNMGKKKYLLSVSGVFNFSDVIIWPLWFLMLGSPH